MQGYVIIDEAAFHDELEEVLKAAFALLIWGGKVLVISTHNGEDNPFNVLIGEIRSGKKPYKILRTDFDEALEDGLYKRICLVSGQNWSMDAECAWRQAIIDNYGDVATEELFCVPSKSGGSWLPAGLIESCALSDIPVVRLAKANEFNNLPKHLRAAEIKDWCEEKLLPHLMSLNKNLPCSFGQDFARSGDLSVIWPLQLSAGMIAITPFIVELRNIPFEQQKTNSLLHSGSSAAL